MTDRELLEKAAKAAGWKGWRSKHGYWNVESPEGEKSTHCHNWDAFCSVTGEKLPEPTLIDAIIESGWIPLAYDGDALRLAVKLGIFVQVLPNESRALLEEWIYELHDSDPYAATRRAIVRAAAAIGETL